MRRAFAVVISLVVATTFLTAVPASALDAELWFPVQITDGVTHHDNYGDCRAGCSRTHRGNDIMAPQMTEVYAAESGYIRRAYGGDSRECLDGGYCTSYGFLIYGDDGNSYFYLHLNSDTPGRPNSCDNRGGAANAFSPRLVDVLRQRGTLQPLPNPYDPTDVVRVEKGELIGYVGSSGNAGCRVDHLHYEMWGGHRFYGADDSRKVDPYPYLKAARDAGRYWGPEGYAPRPGPERHDRVAGSNRVLTSVSLSKAAFTRTDSVVIAPAGVYPEALLAAPLAAAMEAPVLLTWDQQSGQQDVLDDAVAAEIGRLEASYAVIIGSPDRLGPELEDQLVEKTSLQPGDIRRLGGADRYELSRNIADHLMAYHGTAGAASLDAKDSESEPLPMTYAQSSGERSSISPILALGEHADVSRGWPDALAASAVAARERVPVLLTRTGNLPAATREVLGRDGVGEVRVVGGEAAISAEVDRQIREEVGKRTRRLAGANRYQTSLALASEAMRQGAENGRVFVATGEDFPDALASGQTIARQNQILVLVAGSTPDGALRVYDWLRDHAEQVVKVTAVGGPAAVRDDVLRELAVHANWPRD